MPRVKVRYFASLRELLNTGKEEYKVKDGTTLMDLLVKHIPEGHWKVSRKWKERIFETYGGEIKFDRYGAPILKENYTVLINGRHYKWISKMGLMYELRAGDVIVILPPVGGG